MVQGDIIERQNKVIFVDNKENTHTFDKVGESHITPQENVPEKVVNYVKQNSDFNLEKDLEFPLKASTSHHLENTVGRRLEYEHGETLENLIQKGKVDLPSIEIHENWEISEDGSAELVSIKYNGQEYTKD